MYEMVWLINFKMGFGVKGRYHLVLTPFLREVLTGRCNVLLLSINRILKYWLAFLLSGSRLKQRSGFSGLFSSSFFQGRSQF